MKSLRNLCLALLCLVPLSACATANHIRWAQDETSVYAESKYEFSRGVIKPAWTVLWFPFAVVWDVVTFPFQIIGGTYPYGDTIMNPDEGLDI